MKLNIYGKKLIEYLCLLNKPEYLRRRLYSRGKPVPVLLARLLSIGNREKNALKLKTYDGSGQVCHPCVTVFKGNTYMTCTPYPYCKDYYENPCLYRWDGRQDCWSPVSAGFPFVRAKLGETREHYSDPCLFQRNGYLTIVFRKCEWRPDGKVDILYSAVSPNGTDWTPPRQVMEGAGNSLISPAVGGAGDTLFCVEYDGNITTQLTRYSMGTDLSLGERTPCRICGLEPGFFIWHIDVQDECGGDCVGLFMLRQQQTHTTSGKLALFRYYAVEGVWSYVQDVPLSETEEKALRFIYKSSFLPDSNRILCSACDAKGRFFVFEKEIEISQFLKPKVAAL